MREKIFDPNLKDDAPFAHDGPDVRIQLQKQIGFAGRVRAVYTEITQRPAMGKHRTYENPDKDADSDLHRCTSKMIFRIFNPGNFSDTNLACFSVTCVLENIKRKSRCYTALVEYNKNPYDLEPSITVKELYVKWTEEYFKTLKADGSVRAVTSAWAYCSAVYNMRVKDVRARHVKGCMEEGTAVVRGREQHPSASMKNKIKSLFNLMLDYALEYELVDRNYSRTFNLTEETIKEIQTVKKEHMPFTEEEMGRLWTHVDDKRFVDAMLIQCYSGWRPQELGLLELENIDLENWTFKGGMKTDAGMDRVVPIHSRIRPLVERKYKEALTIGSKYLFNCTDGRSGKPTIMTYQRYQKYSVQERRKKHS